MSELSAKPEARDMELAPTRSIWAIIEKFLILLWSVIGNTSYFFRFSTVRLIRSPVVWTIWRRDWQAPG